MIGFDSDEKDDEDDDKEERSDPVGDIDVRGDETLELAPFVACGVCIESLNFDGGPSAGIGVGVKGPGELELSRVIHESVVEMDGDKGQIGGTCDGALEMAFDVSAHGIADDAD